MKKFLLNAENYVLSLLTEKLNKDYLFHNVSNTQQIVNAVKELITGEKISEVDANILLFAAWFYDTGYVKRKENHREASVQIATTFLEEYNIDNSVIDDVVRLIRATKLADEPSDLLEKIMKDAVASYCAKKSFIDKSELLKQETNLLFSKDYTDLDWIQESIKILVKEHRFYTAYAQENWQKGKDKNLAKLVKLEKKLLKVKLADNNLEATIKTDNSTITKTTILLSINSLIIFVLLVGYSLFNENIENQKALIPIIILVISNAILSILIVLPLNFKKELNKDSFIQKISFRRKTLRYSYVVFVSGILISVITYLTR